MNNVLVQGLKEGFDSIVFNNDQIIKDFNIEKTFFLPKNRKRLKYFFNKKIYIKLIKKEVFSNKQKKISFIFFFFNRKKSIIFDQII